MNESNSTLIVIIYFKLGRLCGCLINNNVAAKVILMRKQIGCI